MDSRQSRGKKIGPFIKKLYMVRKFVAEEIKKLSDLGVQTGQILFVLLFIPEYFDLKLRYGYSISEYICGYEYYTYIILNFNYLYSNNRYIIYSLI